MSIQENINSGKYANTLPWPTKPSKTAAMNKRAYELTAEEIATLNAERTQHDAAVSAAEAARAAHRVENGRLESLFYADLCEDNGVDADSASAKKMYRMAWDQGHGNGYTEVANYFEDLCDLYEVIVKEVKK